MSDGYRIPAQTVLLGTVLDLDVDRNATTRIFIEEWKGWLMLTSTTAMDLQRGRARLFLVKMPARVRSSSGRRTSLRGAEVFERWHEREPESALQYEVPDSIGFIQGRALRIGYSSDKWKPRGKHVHYDHSFIEHGARPPKLYTDRATIETSRAAVLVGGDMGISERGIE